jgi:hypothetical protein
LAPGQDLFTLDPEELTKYNGANDGAEKLQYFERKFSQWLQAIEVLLNDDSDSKKETPDVGPRFELDYWRQRMQKITN